MTSGRRAFLVLGLGAGLGLAGCTSVRPQPPGRSASAGSGPKPPTPTPTTPPAPLPGTVDAAARENELAAYATAALRHFATKLSTAERNLLHRLRTAHLVHAAVLVSGTPTDTASGTPGPSASPTTRATPTTPALGHTVSATLARLRTREKTASTAYARLAADPGGPDDRQDQLALLWGSLATAADCYAAACHSSADPGSSPAGEHRADVALPDDADTAITHLLTQCYAIIFGYQSAIAQLSGSRADRAQDRLADYRELRDQLAALLAEHKVAVPAPDAAYRLPVQPTSSSNAGKLIGLMETAVLPYFGQWLAVADADARPAVLRQLTATAEHALAWSGKIIVWPGYPTT